MIIFLDDDPSYLRWVTHHRQGFVLDGRRYPKPKRLVLHRATCDHVKKKGKRTSHLTTPPYIKAYAGNRGELERWAMEQTAEPLALCPDCRPQDPNTADAGFHLTRLGRDILDYVTDAAVIHMEHELPPYQLTVGDIAACLGKTPGQLQPALHQLAGNGLIEGAAATAPWLAKTSVLPTLAGLRAMNACADEDDAVVEQALATLRIV